MQPISETISLSFLRKNSGNVQYIFISQDFKEHYIPIQKQIFKFTLTYCIFTGVKNLHGSFYLFIFL